jgi:nucleotide sugar dehydrogenase
VQIGVFGVGYVGLVTGLCFAEMGNDVISVDIDPNKVEMMKKGQSPIFEQGIDDLMKRNIADGRIVFTTEAKKAIDTSKILFIAVGTPSDKDGSADLKYVLQVAETIATHVTKPLSVVIKSTVPVGTGDKVQKAIEAVLAKRGVNLEIPVISNPEFLREGTAIEDCLRPDRIVIGVSKPEHADTMKELYEPFVRNGHPVIAMERRSSEMTKYAANSFLATKISFMNELSRLCEKVGANIDDIRSGIGSDKRIGMQFLYAGIGYGGSCFPKDVRAMMKTSEENGMPLTILDAVEAVNETQIKHTIGKAFDMLKSVTGPKKIALWGVAFKPGTDDIREAPALEVINAMLKEGVEIRAFDPIAAEHAKKEFGQHKGLEFVHNQYEALEGADLLVIATEWKQFREPNFETMKEKMRSPKILDGRNIYRPEAVRKLGFEYVSVGRR